MATELASSRYEVADTPQAIEFCFEQGWTDGLRARAAHARACAGFLTLAALDPARCWARWPIGARDHGREGRDQRRHGRLLPAYFPVVVAAIQALTDDAFCLHGSMASTGGAAPLLIVNGPIRDRSRSTPAATSWSRRRANATIGRAIRLLLNVCGAEPGVLESIDAGPSRKFSYCIAEDEEATGWAPLHVERGLGPDDSAVTVMAAEAPHYVRNSFGQRPRTCWRRWRT